MTMHKALHARDDVDRLYESRKEGEKELASIQNNIDALIKRLEDYMKKYEGRLITATRDNTDNASIKRTKITRKMGRKITIWILQAINKLSLIRENLDMAKKGKPQERN